MAVNDVYRLIIKGRQVLSIRINELAVRHKLAPDATPAEQLALANDFKNLWLPVQSSSAAWETWELRQLWGTGMTPVASECRRDGGVVTGGALTGTLTGGRLTGDALPPQAAVVVTLVTGAIGRRKRGRWYGWGCAEVDQASGTWATSMHTDLAPTLATFLAKYGPSGTDPTFQLGVWSERTASGCTPSGPDGELVNVETPHPELAFTPVTALTIRPIVYNQRRRTVGVGA